MELKRYLEAHKQKGESMSFEPAVITLREGSVIIGQVGMIDEENVMVKDGLKIETIGIDRVKSNTLMLVFMPVNLFSSDSIWMLKRKDVLTIVTPLDAVYHMYLENLEMLKVDKINFGDFGEWLIKNQKKEEATIPKDSGEKVVDMLSRLGRSPPTKH